MFASNYVALLRNFWVSITTRYDIIDLQNPFKNIINLYKYSSPFVSFDICIDANTLKVI